MALVFKVGDHSQMPPVPEDFPKCGNYIPSPKKGKVIESVVQESDRSSGIIPNVNYLCSVFIFMILLLRFDSGSLG